MYVDTSPSKIATNIGPSYSESNNSSLAQASWDNFTKYLSRYQWAFDDPAASPRKSEIKHALAHRGEKGSCTFRREDGRKFILRPLAPWAFEQSINKQRKVYYASYGRSALLYLDVDLHQVFQRQSDGKAAVAEINRTRLPLYWIDSTRGFNGYLKVKLGGSKFDEANKVFQRLQNALRLLLAEDGNLCDFEVKGRVGFLQVDQYSWSQYGKLPIHNPKWSWAELEKFAATREVTVQGLERLCAYIEARVPQAALEKHETYKKTLRSQPRIENGHFLLTDELEIRLKERGVWLLAMNCSWSDGESFWVPVSFLLPTETSLEQPELQEIAVDGQESPVVDCEVLQKQEAAFPAEPRSPLRVKASVGDLVAEPDSFQRQREGLLRFARALKRLPSLTEALNHIRANNLFTGCWNDNAGRRKSRVLSILKFIGRTFDSSKCSKGSVNVGKYDAWAKKKFPNGISVGKRRWISHEGEIIEAGEQIQVGPQFIGTFLAICEFSLVIDKNQDGSVPHRRAKQLWNSLHAKGLVAEAFNDRKWAVCRKHLVSLGIIQITDRDFGPGKAMRWALDKFFPFLGLWKQPKKVVVADSVSLQEFLKTWNKRTTQEHNTLLYKQPMKSATGEHLLAPRPPP